MKNKIDIHILLKFFVCWLCSGIMASSIFLSLDFSSKLPPIFLGVAISFIFSFSSFAMFLLPFDDKNKFVKNYYYNVGYDGYENVKQMLKELEKTDDEFGTLLGKVERNISTSEWVAFDNIFGVLLRFKQWYLKGCIDYHNNGNTPCAKNKQSYFCNGCAIYDLTPWRADWNLRCPTGNTTQFKK